MTASTIGMNLSGVRYWSTEFPFIDRMKTAGNWTAQDMQWAPMNAVVSTDANGYPTSIPVGGRQVYTMISLDPASAASPARYVLSYSGNATFFIADGKIISSSPGTVVFDYSGTGGYTQLAVTSEDPAHPLTEMHIVRQDQLALFQAGEIFNPALVAEVSHWGVLRFMDWGNTNNSTLVSWDQRTTLSSMTWAGNNSLAGVPIEVMVKLANETHVDMWINMPAQANDDYVRRTLQYVHDNLNPDLHVTVEYSNEVWNWGFTQSQYALTMGDQLWGRDANHDGVINSKDPAEHVGDGWVQYYGYRSAQIADINRSIFGAEFGTRSSDVIGTQTMYLGLEKSIFAGIAKANLGATSSLFQDYAITTYFGGNLANGNAADHAQVLAWAKAGAAGVDAAFREIEFGGTLTFKNSLADMVAVYNYQAAVAAKYGLSLVAYEGGFGDNVKAFATADQATIIDFFNRLEADPRMASLYDRMASDFFHAGGTTLNVFNDVGQSSVYGSWGLSKSIYDLSSPRHDTLVQLSDALKSEAADALRPNADVGSGNSSLRGDAGNNVINGGGGNETFFMQDGGNDTVNAGDGNDIIYFGGALNALDRVDGGAGTRDVLVLQGNYANLTLDAQNFTNIEFVSLQSGSITRFGDDGTHSYDYNITTTDAAVGAGQILQVNGQSLLAGEDLTFDGSAETNGKFLIDGGHGVDTLKGGAGNDIFFFEGDRWGASDTVVGGAGNDAVVISGVNGLNHIEFGETSLTGIEAISVNNRFAADPTATPSYEFILHNGNVAAGANLTVNGSSLKANQSISVDGSLVHDGALSLDGGGADDTLIGGANGDVLYAAGGADTLTGGGGADIFQYRSVSDSSVAASDHILDFASGTDKIDLHYIDANMNAEDDQAFTLSSDGSFHNLAGELRETFDASHGWWVVEGDVNGDGLADFAIHVTTVGNAPLVGSDFLL